MSYTHLSFEEREVIHDSKVFRLDISQISFKLKRHPSSIYRKIKRNQNKLGSYTINEAQRKCHKRRQNKIRKIIKVNIEPFVLKYLAIGASSEQISERLKLEYQKDKDRTVYTETIY